MIRQADVADVALVAPLVTAFFEEEGIDVDETVWRANLSAMIADPRSCFLVAIEDGATTGFATATCTNGIEFGRSAEIEDLFVLPALRGRGLGRRLFEAVLAWAQDLDARMAIVVLTPAGQADAGLDAFYESFGFVTSDRQIRYRTL